MKSVLAQTYDDIEYIVIDGGSTDGTMDVIENGKRQLVMGKGQGSAVIRIISEPDKGIYDALNKGIKLATGDVIGFLHADDIYADASVIGKVAAAMSQSNADSCYGDLVYVRDRGPGSEVMGNGRGLVRRNTHYGSRFTVVRYWKSRPYENGLFERGWMPPHPTFFVRRKVYETFGFFDTSFKIAADYELMLRFLHRHGISTQYIPEVLIKMRLGGASNGSLKNIFIKTAEDYKAWRVNHLQNRFYTIPFKNLSKIPQFFIRRGARNVKGSDSE